MRDISRKIFSSADMVIRKRGQEQISLRGVITAMDREESKEPTALGYIIKPHYLFMGSVGDVRTGDRMVTQDNKDSYIVLSASEVSAFGKKLCLQAILEKEGENDC